MRWLTIAASLALACAPLARAAQSSTSASSSSTSTTTKHSTHKHKHYAKRQPGQKAPTSDRISEIQSALAREGYLKGDPNGKMDANTVAALEKFQSDNGLDANGKLDAQTLQKLGLGSDIAGVAAPKPIVPACCSMSSGSTLSGDKPASSCCSMPASQQSQPAPSTPPASSATGPSGTTSTESKPAQQ
jgi:peptidoglycan hydrolase-like protein with peptidoglycan-binding domain